jgi:hypothetical protein
LPLAIHDPPATENQDNTGENQSPFRGKNEKPPAQHLSDMSKYTSRQMMRHCRHLSIGYAIFFLEVAQHKKRNRSIKTYHLGN